MDAAAWGEVAKIAGGAVASLVVSLIGISLQRGTKYRRIRRDLTEELELLRVLRDRDPTELTRRVEARVQAFERQYNWQLAIPPEPALKVILRFVVVPAAIAGLIVGFATFLDLGWAWWVVALVGAGAGLTSVVGEWAADGERRMKALEASAREQNS